jgi:hypothetical protein
MFGVKINEFDNSDGTIESFNEIFPKTPLERKSDHAVYADIGKIFMGKDILSQNSYIRFIKFYDKDWNLLHDIIHDFGCNNFFENDDFVIEGNVRYKYIAKDYDGNFLAKAYNKPDLAKKLGTTISVIDRRLEKKFDKTSLSVNKFNITRKKI